MIYWFQSLSLKTRFLGVLLLLFPVLLLHWLNQNEWAAAWGLNLFSVIAYAAFLTAATLYLLKKANPRGPWWYLLPLLPPAAAACDLLTNVPWLGFLTPVKWTGLALTGLVLIAGGGATLVRAVLARRSARGYTERD